MPFLSSLPASGAVAKAWPLTVRTRYERLPNPHHYTITAPVLLFSVLKH